MSLRLKLLGFTFVFLTGLFGFAFAHEHENSDDFKADPDYFSSRESCPEGFFWQQVVNKTDFHVRVFIDGKSFSTEIYSLSPKTVTNEINSLTGKPKELYYGAIRCFPEEKHEIKITAFVYRKMPLGMRGVVEILQGEKKFFYDSKSEDLELANPLMIEKKELRVIRLLSWDNATHNSGLFFLLFLIVFFIVSVFVMLSVLFRRPRHDDS